MLRFWELFAVMIAVYLIKDRFFVLTLAYLMGAWRPSTG
jgi:hypothetical protein